MVPLSLAMMSVLSLAVRPQMGSLVFSWARSAVMLLSWAGSEHLVRVMIREFVLRVSIW